MYMINIQLFITQFRIISICISTIYPSIGNVFTVSSSLRSTINRTQFNHKSYLCNSFLKTGTKNRKQNYEDCIDWLWKNGERDRTDCN